MFDNPTGLLPWAFLIPYPYFGWLQGVVVVAVGLLLGLRYRAFGVDLVAFATSFLGLFLIVVLLYLIVYAQVGTGLGLQNLFWSEEFHVRIFSSMGATMLLGLIGSLAFNLDPAPEQTARKTSRFLGEPEPPTGPARAPRGSGVGGLVVAAGRAAWAGPTGVNLVRLRLFLRAIGFPFLVLLALPALVPDVFAAVPPVSPTVLKGLPAWSDWLAIQAPPTSFFGYMLGVASWLAGIGAGVALFGLLIRLSEPTYILLGHPATRAIADGIGRSLHLAGRALTWPIRALGDGLARTYAAARRRLGRPDLPADPPPPEADPDDPESRDRQAALRNLILWFLIVYLLAGAPRPFPFYDNLPPSVAICLILGALAVTVAGLAYFQPRRKYLPIGAFFVYLVLLNNQFFTLFGLLSPFKDRLPHMEAYYDDPGDAYRLRRKVDTLYFPYKKVPDPDAGRPGAQVALVEDEAARVAWRGTFPAAEKPKLVVVCVSGGAARSAYWTAVVLEKLATIPGFNRSIRLITGASGGMLGTACHVEALYRGLRPDPSRPVPDSVPAQVPARSLDELARYIAVRDIPRALLPRLYSARDPRTGAVEEYDRGTILENDWAFLAGRKLADYAALEREGKLPSLVFSPMIVEDGRLLLISNLDLRPRPAPPDRQDPDLIVLASGGKITDRLDGSLVEPYALTGFEFFKLFPLAGEFRLSTAVRMNASFPLVSPAVELPTRTRRRVVDAGYYDNYGVQVAAAWLGMNLDWLVENTSGVLLVQVRDGLSVLDRWEVDDRAPSPWDRIERGLDLVLGPIRGALSARTATTMFRNDYATAGLSRLFAERVLRRRKLDAEATERRRGEALAFFSTIVFENPAGLIWRTDASQVDQFPGDSLIAAVDAARRENRDPSGEVRAISPLDLNRVVGRSQSLAMTWYLTPAERLVMAGSFPSPGEPWAAETDEMFWDRIERIDLLARLSTTLVDEARDLALKDLVHVRNYQRFLTLRDGWWKVDHSPR